MNRTLSGSLIVPLVLLVVVGSALRTGTQAKEATKQGRNATIVWVDETGTQHETRGGEIRYGYFTRAQLSVPKDGKNFHDDEHQTNGLSFARSYIKFSKIARIDFRYEKVVDSGGTRLEISITPLKGKLYIESGNTLSGSAHPLSPFIAFRVDGVEQRIDLHPLGTDKDRSGQPRIVSADFKL